MRTLPNDPRKSWLFLIFFFRNLVKSKFFISLKGFRSYGYSVQLRCYFNVLRYNLRYSRLALDFNEPVTFRNSYYLLWNHTQYMFSTTFIFLLYYIWILEDTFASIHAHWLYLVMYLHLYIYNNIQYFYVGGPQERLFYSFNYV